MAMQIKQYKSTVTSKNILKFWIKITHVIGNIISNPDSNYSITEKVVPSLISAHEQGM